MGTQTSIRHTSGGKPRTLSLLSWVVQFSLADLLRYSVLAAKSGRTGMPYGYSWPAYLRFAGAAMLSMFAGAQCVHQLYRPLDVS